MRNSLFERPKALAVIVIVGCAVSGGLWWMMREQHARTRDAIREAEGGTPQKAAGSSRVEEVRKIQHSEPETALAKLRVVLEKPADAAERQAALELLPPVMANSFRERVKAKKYEEAATLLAEMEEEIPDSSEYPTAVRQWGQSLWERWREAVKGGKKAEADELWALIEEGDHLQGNNRLLKDYQEVKVKEWIAARKAGDAEAAQAALLEAARVFVSTHWNTPLVDALWKQDAIGMELYEGANELCDQGFDALAVPFYKAALRKLESGREGSFSMEPIPYEKSQELRRTIERRIAEVQVGIADSLRAGEFPVLTVMKPIEIYDGAARMVREEADRVLPLRRKLEVQVGEFEATVAPMREYDVAEVTKPEYLSEEAVKMIYDLSQDARRVAGEVLDKTAVALWNAKLAQPAFDPWDAVPSDVADEIWQAVPEQEKEDERRAMLLEMLKHQQYRPPFPEVVAVEEGLYEVFGRWGLLYMNDNTGEGFRMLRSALRGTKNMNLRSQIADGLQRSIQLNLDKQDFDMLYELAGFYVSEIGVSEQSDPFRKEFKECLQKAAASFAEKSQMKHIFILTLLAETYPGEEVGRKARGDAIRLAYEAVSNVAMQPEPEQPELPSGVEGVSVVAMDNSTEYHLLCFYDGPERFFVRCSPYRKGSIVLRDGPYIVAVLTPTGDIRPFKGEVRLNSELQSAEYRIETIDRDSGKQTVPQWMSASRAQGDYGLFHAPKTLGAVEVEPETGALVSVGSPP